MKHYLYLENYLQIKKQNIIDKHKEYLKNKFYNNKNKYNFLRQNINLLNLYLYRLVLTYQNRYKLNRLFYKVNIPRSKNKIYF